ncbi:unnamed protein product [Phytophthora fragariaefolia]|uniref:Unnamed protein product n=1 Tax=Phytophthora fragariaefolia TaxID=1490495 RepID=A0A9W6TQ59_9STRA|nr:unnamed protein product [Phytophthora fragariaefolia]
MGTSDADSSSEDGTGGTCSQLVEISCGSRDGSNTTQLGHGPCHESIQLEKTVGTKDYTAQSRVVGELRRHTNPSTTLWLFPF